MELRDYLHILAKRWRLGAALVLLCMAGAIGATFATPPTYEAEAQVFVSTRGLTDVSELSQASNFSQQRVKSYTKIVTSPRVTEPVINRLGLELTSRELANKITAESPPETVLISIRARDSSPQQAAKIANATSRQLGQVVKELENPPGPEESPVKLSTVRQAEPPTSPVSPRPLVNIGLGLASGLALGVGLIALLESLDTSVKTANDLSATTGLPVLGTIPRDVPHDRRMEAFRQLRTNLQFAQVDDKPRLITLTSAVREEGKSTVAGNLAVTLAQVGQRVCLVDSDLRNPHIADYMNLVGEAGLTNVLIGQASVGEVVQRAGTRLDVLASGPVPPNPSELLASQRMEHLMRDLLGRYDMVIIDTPPLLPVTDGVVLTSQADGALLIVRAAKTTRPQVVQAVESLHNVGARVLGAVLNMTPGKGGDGHAYGYGSRPETTRQYDSAGRHAPTVSAGNGRSSSSGDGRPARPAAQDRTATAQNQRRDTATAENETGATDVRPGGGTRE